MEFFNLFKKKQVNSEASRIEHLEQHGRITEGIIIDSETSDTGEEIVFYVYTIQGVDFESSEMLTEEKLLNIIKYAPGAKVGVRFDPKNHGNSMLV